MFRNYHHELFIYMLRTSKQTVILRYQMYTAGLDIIDIRVSNWTEPENQRQ